MKNLNLIQPSAIFDYVFWGNSIYHWAVALGIVAGLFLLIKLFKYFVVKKVKSWALTTNTNWDNFLIAIVENSVIPLLYISSFYFALSTLNFDEKLDKIIHVAYLVAISYFILRVISAAFRKFVYSFIQREENSESKEKQAGGLIVIANVIIWILGIIFLMDNLGYNVTTLIAGLGVGGIAIALAAQAVLGDLFSYFVIFFDRPFEIGDFVVVGDKNGVIEYIGIKTTRIRTLSGEQLICSNTDLTNSRLHNFKRMQKRRIIFSLGVTYHTSHAQLSKIPELIKKVIANRPKLQFDRSHFSGYGDFSLNFETVYYVLDPDYNVYMDNQQAIYLDIFEAFEQRGIEFAYPTQTLFVNSEITPDK
ncbi:small-conductance mechanosensitive channel [Pedobacter sp. AK017]|uniref:mechanosensitive ion channel family protein n=1 Tax=Pedobacter sp. AK017 TaxID=2723073 RepID=UPI00161ED267|nr:mechanosensitive ion channel family protein [Pedobacter sp. AK017]MBB5438163.1 small-conductance mechanosensitive channel [Pedobacter sp. AK017]